MTDLQDPTTEELSEIIGNIDDLMRKEDRDTIEMHLAAICAGIEVQNALVILTWLRTTSPFRTYLSNWRYTLYRVAAELTRRGLDERQLLRGLLG